MKDLKSPYTTYSIVADRNHIGISSVLRIFDEHVSIKRKPLCEVLSIDEHYFPQSTYKSSYCCIFMDFKTGIILDVLPDRKKEYIGSYLSKIKAKTYDSETRLSELDNVKYISIDMYEPYREIAKTYFPHAIVCADAFHVIEHLNDRFRVVRLRIKKTTEDDKVRYVLSTFKFIFGHRQNLDNEGKYNKKFVRVMTYRDLMNYVFQQ
ncbi:MAG: transposase, partial [Erysipelotrichaceae bacterium]|nr:transposase [Erysipelotrichaceae bacterium]